MSRSDQHIWGFSDSLPANRVTRLLNYRSFDDVLELLERTSKLLKFTWEQFNDDRLKGCHRASFKIRVSVNAYDAFFNSPVGYRAQFAKSATAGEIGNRALLDKMKTGLLNFADAQSTVSFDLLRKSIEATDAKIWIYEPEVETHLGDDVPEILYPPWHQSSVDGVGLRAPEGNLLEVKGGWLDGGGNERPDRYKAERSSEIHSVGFS